MGIKNKKGSVVIENQNGRIRLRWRVQTKRYSISLSSFSEFNLLQAKKVALQIEQDIALDTFDTSLVKYAGNAKQTSLSSMSFVQLFEHWVTNYKNMDCAIHTNYNSTRSMIVKWGKVDASNIVRKLNAETNVAVTYNRRLTILKSFTDWLMGQNLWDANPLLSVQRKRSKKQTQSTREPFTEVEIRRILEAFKSNKYCSKQANFKHEYYYPFVYFLFKTVARNAEVVGLRVKHINLEKKLVYIKEVLARTIKNSASKNRVRKSTKNDKERVLPLTEDLEQVLLPLLKNKQSDSLVFLSPTGKAIYDNNFNRRIFKKVLAGLGIQDRVLYACRHTFASRCIDQGVSPVMTAFLMGNNPQTALRNYTHQLNIPDNLPSI